MDNFRKPSSSTVSTDHASTLLNISDNLCLQPIKRKDREQLQLNYKEEADKLEKLTKDLKSVEERLTLARTDCYKLNIDLVTQFDPFFVEKIKSFEKTFQEKANSMKEILQNVTDKFEKKSNEEEMQQEHIETEDS